MVLMAKLHCDALALSLLDRIPQLILLEKTMILDSGARRWRETDRSHHCTLCFSPLKNVVRVLVPSLFVISRTRIGWFMGRAHCMYAFYRKLASSQ